MGPLTGDQLGNKNKSFKFSDLTSALQGIDPESGFMDSLPDLAGGLSELANGSPLGYYETKSVAQGEAHGKSRGSSIGKMAGAALTPILGPLAAPLGGLVGGLIGAKSAKKKAQEVVTQRQHKTANTRDMYQDLASQRKTISDQENAFYGSI